MTLFRESCTDCHLLAGAQRGPTKRLIGDEKHTIRESEGKRKNFEMQQGSMAVGRSEADENLLGYNQVSQLPLSTINNEAIPTESIGSQLTV